MELKKLKTDTKIYSKMLAIALIVIIIAGIVAAAVKTDGDNVLVREVNLTTRGTKLSGMMYVPKDALEVDETGDYVDKRPAVILSHGYLNSNQMQDPDAMELSRRGFVVLSMDMYGHGNSELNTTSEEPTGTVTGTMDFYEYVLALPYVDHTRIGFAGHSMGGMNTGNAIAIESGFYTLEDKLLNLLSDEFGAAVTAEDVAAQDPEAVAAQLGEYEKGAYDTRKAEIEAEHAIRPKAELFIGSGTGFAFMADSHVVEVAGHEVWRDLQSNVGVALGIYEENAWLMFGSAADGINDSARIRETSMAKRLFGTVEGIADERVWYGLNLSSDAQQLQSTAIVGMDEDDYQNAALRTAIDAGEARIIYQPAEEHVQNHFSLDTVSFVVDFFSTVMNYNNGELAEGAQPIDSENSVWLVKEIANGVMLVAFLIAIYAIAVLLLQTPFFSSLKGKPAEPTRTKRDKSFWVCAVLFVVIPAVTYIPFFLLGGSPTTAAGNTGPFTYSWFFSEEMATRVGIWAFLNGVIDFAILVVKYLIVDKKQGRSFKESLMLPISGKGFGKSLLLAFVVFGLAAVLVALCNFFFANNDPRFWVMTFREPTQHQLISWLCYLIIYFVFYFVNSVVINTSRMKDMSEGKNMALCAVINGLGIGIFLMFNYIYMTAMGHLPWYDIGQDYFLSVAVVFPMVAVLPIAAVYSRKLYLKTGSVWLGALINTLVFTWFVVGNTTSHFSMFMG